MATDRESPLRIQYCEVFTRPGQEANGQILPKRPQCNAIVVRTPPAYRVKLKLIYICEINYHDYVFMTQSLEEQCHGRACRGFG